MSVYIYICILIFFISKYFIVYLGQQQQFDLFIYLYAESSTKIPFVFNSPIKLNKFTCAIKEKFFCSYAKLSLIALFY